MNQLALNAFKSHLGTVISLVVKNVLQTLLKSSCRNLKGVSKCQLTAYANSEIH